MDNNKELKIVFLWHWLKRSTPELNGVFAAKDSLIHAIGLLSQEYDIKLISLSKDEDYELYSSEQNIYYIFRSSWNELINEVRKINPDILFINHHPSNYTKILKNLSLLRAKKIIYYSSPIRHLSGYHKALNAHLVHHEYQKAILLQKGVDAKKVYVAPKTADLSLFKPVKTVKKWDCIYPMRGKIGYWKRPELAIKACKIKKFSICMPGAVIPPKYNWVTTYDKWVSQRELAKLYNQSKCLVITSNDREMGPRVIPEAAACNIPIVCCNDNRACVSWVKKIGGFIAEPDPVDIAEKIEEAISSTNVEYRENLIKLGYDSDLIYKVLNDILDNFSKMIYYKNTLTHWNEKYSGENVEIAKKWNSPWRLVLYKWCLRDIKENECSILDIGGGPGYGLKKLKEMRPKVNIIRMDFSDEAEKNAVIPFIKKNVLEDDFSKLEFDYVLCIETLEHFKDPLYILERVIPMAKKKVIITVPYMESVSKHTEHEFSFDDNVFNQFNIEKLEIRKRGGGKIMKIVISNSKKMNDVKIDIKTKLYLLMKRLQYDTYLPYIR